MNTNTLDYGNVAVFAELHALKVNQVVTSGLNWEVRCYNADAKRHKELTADVSNRSDTNINEIVYIELVQLHYRA